MSDLFTDPSVAWAAVLILVLPLAIIGIGEVEERLRQRDSPLQGTASILRVWVVPVFVLWILARTLLELDQEHLVTIALGSVLVVSGGVAALSALAVAVVRLRDRPRLEGKRAVPRLLLALPRLCIILATLWFLIAGVWNIDLSAALTALGVTSLVVSFALQDTLSGIASGFLLLTDQPFQAGDWIEYEELEGRVVDVNWRSARIRDRSGDLVIVPNALLANAVVTNFDEPTRLHKIVVELQVAYVNAPTAAKEMLLAAARATPGVLDDPVPEARVVQIDDPLMGYEVHMWIDDYTIAPNVKSDFGSLVWYFSHRHDVPLPSPAQDLYLYDGVEAGIAEVLDRPEIRRRLRTSPLLNELDEDTLDQFAAAATRGRYARGETIIRSGGESDLFLLTSGRARIVLRRPGTEDHKVLDLEPGELFGVREPAAATEYIPIVVATSDCEVLQIAAETAGTVISRTPALSDAIEQLSTTRQRRIGRGLRRLGVVEVTE